MKLTFAAFVTFGIKVNVHADFKVIFQLILEVFINFN